MCPLPGEETGLGEFRNILGRGGGRGRPEGSWQPFKRPGTWGEGKDHHCVSSGSLRSKNHDRIRYTGDWLEETPVKGTGKEAREGRGEPWDGDAGLLRRRQGRKKVPDCGAVLRKSWPAQRDVLKPKSPISGKEWPALAPLCAHSLSRRSLWEVKLQWEYGGRSRRTEAGAIRQLCSCRRRCGGSFHGHHTSLGLHRFFFFCTQF